MCYLMIGIDILKKDIPKYHHRMDTTHKAWWDTYLMNLVSSKKVSLQSRLSSLFFWVKGH